ncbi:MAG: tagaturonate epimerase family protein [Terrimicrobiaceae bacterium]|nr:tagaturonate epimerase family protein [Terrimicrobiaceae bacterium]
MKTPLLIEKYSIGIGDRFGREGVAQLAALQKAAAAGVEVIPVWNKSNREHTLIGSTPADTRSAAEAAVKAAGWSAPYHLDADHIGLKTVDRFLPHCDFYTIDVADFIGQEAGPGDISGIRDSLQPLIGKTFPGLGLDRPLDTATVENFLGAYALAIREAGQIYRHIESARGKDHFIAEVSTDEAETPQSPLDLFLILGALAGEGVRVQTIAPKFTGRFNKGVDYVGDVRQFAREFERDLLAIRAAVAEFGLPQNLKVSIHSGSDKFSLYGPVRELLEKHGAGLHLKTAGTNWLEEVIGLALAGGNGLEIAKEIYAKAFDRIDELSQPYATVIDIRRDELPVPATVSGWNGEALAAALTHEPSDPRFNSSLRQLVHISFKVAAEMGPAYLDAIDAAHDTIANCVTNNLYDRHLGPLFMTLSPNQ